MNELNRHFPRLRTLGKDMNSGLNGFHAILPTLKKKLSSSTVRKQKAFVKKKKKTMEPTPTYF
ncbi:hypothetical protein T02_13968 [Trichinella nativa]|uniref:Uncharacterized protein n=1 Tax=Trichinella nativa TaxID=6335 RepID=A0A0V1L9S9_9BILA|nr:hypothetical protein T02_13968 [Trichinella nativa]